MRRRDVLETMAVGTVATAAGCMQLQSAAGESPSVAWTYEAPTLRNLEIDETHAVIATERELVGLSRADGDVAWRHRLDSLSGLEHDESGYYAAGAGGVVAVDRSSGEQRWRVDGRYRGLHRAESAIVCSDVEGGETVGFDPRTGARLWSMDDTRIRTYTPTFGLVTGDEYAAVDLNEGTIEWTIRPGEASLILAVTDDLVVVSVLTDPSWKLVAFDRTSGTERWRFEGENARSWDGGVIDGTLYATETTGSESRRLYAIDLESGRARWSTELDPAFGVSQVMPEAVVGEAVLVSTPWVTGDPTTDWKSALPTTAWVDRTTESVEWTESGRGVVTKTSEVVVLAREDGTFVGCRPDGTVVWEDTMTVSVKSSSHGADEYTYAPLEVVALDDAFVAASTGSSVVEKWDSTAGTRHWSLSLEDTVHTLFATRGDVYALADGTLSAIRTD